MGERVELELTVRTRGDEIVTLRGAGPSGMLLVPERGAGNPADVHSSRRLARRVARVPFNVRWSEEGGARVSPPRTANVLYTTMNRPRDDQQGLWPEDGVTLRRMDRAVSWVAPLATLRPHAIVRALMEKFPFYSLHPSPKVPRKYHHPTYFNDEGGAWPMSDYVDESGECQAIVRLVRGILRQVGVPGEARAVLVWGDPDVEGGKKALSAYWDERPDAGLDRVKVRNDSIWVAALVDMPVEVGKTYPAPHTPRRDGPSPGLNRFEACLEFSDGRRTVDYGGGAGIYRDREEVLRGFWGLVWVSPAPHHGFRVEEIVTQYREE
jgi:hypothetical protein